MVAALRRMPVLRHPIAIGVAIIVALGLFQALEKVHQVLLLAFLAVLVATVLSFPVNVLARWMSRSAAVVLSLLVVVGAGAGFVALVVPVVNRQVQELTRQVPDALSRLRGLVEQLRRSGAVNQLPQGAQVASRVQSKAGQVAEAAVNKTPAAAVNILGGLATVVLLVVLAAFLAASPDAYRRGLRALVPREHEEAFDEAWLRLARALRKWVGGISVAMVMMGLFTGVGLALAGINAALVLGLLTGLATFVPYAGALASAVPGLLVALSQSPRHLLYALLVYAGVHLVEGYLVEPLVMKRAVRVRPAVLLVTQAISGTLFGVLGIVVATPMLVCVQELVAYLYVERRLGKGPAARALV